MTNLYFDNAATSWPKPPAVIDAVTTILRDIGGNAGRSGHAMGQKADEIVYNTREEAARFFGLDDPSRVIFTSNCTESLNLALKGVLRPGDHCLTTAMEHNSVIRPLNRLAREGIITYDIIPADAGGRVDPGAVARYIKPNTRLMVATHASNVSGIIQPVEAFAGICQKHGILLLVDAAQSAGIVPLSMQAAGIDMLAAPGHKALLGPQGTGILVVGSKVSLKPLKEGGTGTESGNLFQPEALPEALESGTLNLPGIGGLHAGLRHIRTLDITRIWQKKQVLYARLADALAAIPGILLVGRTDPQENTGVISIRMKDGRSAELATRLCSRHEVKLRYGLHCAPLAHRSLGSFPEGTLRFSLGYTHEAEDVDFLADLVRREMAAV